MNAYAKSTRIDFLIPHWPVPATVRAAFTLRSGGVSSPPFDSLNVAAHVGDEAQAVAQNRRILKDALRLPSDPVWMEQVHGLDVLNLDAAFEGTSGGTAVADAAFTRGTDKVCAVQVADCLPVLFAVRDGSAVAAAHAGWRGLAGGVLEATVQGLSVEPSALVAWVGPGIGAANFEVGEEVRSALVAHKAAPGAFVRNARGRWQCNLVTVARAQLAMLGISAVFGGEWCTYADAVRFFSYRRDGRCGRMAALIWREA
jgi:purine-nucleoside/S-methyl-5'-thioadenosine phosphorylase / adenosine deaminase